MRGAHRAEAPPGGAVVFENSAVRAIAGRLAGSIASRFDPDPRLAWGGSEQYLVKHSPVHVYAPANRLDTP